MSAAIALPAEAWVPLTDEDLALELAGAAIGERTDGELSACGRWLVALWTVTEPIRYERHELYRREGEGWRVWTSHLTREAARAEVGRQRQLALERNRDLCLRCMGSGWRDGDDCTSCVGSGTREAQV